MQTVTALDWATFVVATISLFVFVAVIVLQYRVLRLQQRLAHASRGLVRIDQSNDSLDDSRVNLKVSAKNVGREVAFDVRAEVESPVDIEITPASYSPTWVLVRGQSLGLTFSAASDGLARAGGTEGFVNVVITLSYTTMGLDVRVRNYYKWDGKRFELVRAAESVGEQQSWVHQLLEWISS